MHEMSLAQDIIEIITKHLPDNTPDKDPVVESVKVIVGLYSGVEVECLTFAFDVLKKEGPCAEAKMEIDIPAPTSRCMGCDKIFPGYPLMKCPSCGHAKLKLEDGMEFRVKSFELKD